MDLKLGDQLALVAGAGAGIGASIGATLVEHGCSAFVADSNAAAKFAAQLGGRGYPLTLDVASASEAVAAVEQTVCERGRIDTVVNNAGILKTRPVLDASIADWDEVCRVNLSGGYYSCKAALASTVKQQYGRSLFFESPPASGKLSGVDSMSHHLRRVL